MLVRRSGGPRDRRGRLQHPISRPPACTIPANLPGSVISGNEFGTPSAVFVRVAADGTETAVDFTYAAPGAFPYLSYGVIPSAPLEVGAHYRIYPGECRLGRPGANVPFDYMVGPEVPLPTTLGTLSFTPLHSYYYHYSTYLTPSAEMAPWLWAYDVTTVATHGRDSGIPRSRRALRSRSDTTSTLATSASSPPPRSTSTPGPMASGTTFIDCASAVEVERPDGGTTVHPRASSDCWCRPVATGGAPVGACTGRALLRVVAHYAAASCVSVVPRDR